MEGIIYVSHLPRHCGVDIFTLQLENIIFGQGEYLRSSFWKVAP